VIATLKGLTEQDFFHRSIFVRRLIDSAIEASAGFAALDLAVRPGGSQFENCSISVRRLLGKSSLWAGDGRAKMEPEQSPGRLEG
jgi:hypothetical protein